MNSYIAYLDLLGIKDLARYSPNKYFEAMEIFRNHLISTASIFNENGYSKNSKIFFFSDSAFIESDDIKTLINYFIILRKELNRKNLFFTAAITEGCLDACHFSGIKDLKRTNIDAQIKNIIKGQEEFVRGTIFQAKDIISVYLFQNDLKSIGIFMDKSIFDKSSNNLENIKNEYLTKIFYFPNVNESTACEFYDLKLSKSERDKSFFKIVIERYHNVNVKNKKFGRYFLPHFANWISCIQFIKNENLICEILDSNKILSETDNDFDDDLLIFIKLIKGNDTFLSELKRSAQCFEYLYFFLLNCLYEQFNEYNKIILYTIKAIKKYSKCKKYITKMDDLPDNVLSHKNKDRFIEDYSKTK